MVMLLVFDLGVVLWIICGFLINSSFTLALISGILTLKACYDSAAG